MTKPDKILAHELLDREVLNLKAGEVAGSVVDFGINRDGKVQLIGILPVAWYGGGRGIAPASITFLTNDRLCIANGEALQDFAPDGEGLISTNSGGQIYGKTVLLGDGEQLGELVDFRFSLDDGKISDLLVLDGEEKRVRIAISGISTIGKDYIIIERAAPEGAEGASNSAASGMSAGSPAAGEESPFSDAAAVAPAPAAAKKTASPTVRPPVPAAAPARKATPGRKGRSTDKSTSETTEPEVVAEAAPPAAPPTPPAASAAAAPFGTAAPSDALAGAESSAVSKHEGTSSIVDSALGLGTASKAAPVEARPASKPEPAPRETSSKAAPSAGAVPSKPEGNGLGAASKPEPIATTVTSQPEPVKPSAPPQPEQASTSANAAAAVSAAADEVSLFAGSPQISKFDQKKLEFLRDKYVPRDVKGPDGVILLAKDEQLTNAALKRILDAGMLGEVFIEMTLRK